MILMAREVSNCGIIMLSPYFLGASVAERPDAYMALSTGGRVQTTSTNASEHFTEQWKPESDFKPQIQACFETW